MGQLHCLLDFLRYGKWSDRLLRYLPSRFLLLQPKLLGQFRCVYYRMITGPHAPYQPRAQVLFMVAAM
jgi:hypothetical protein